jgi:phage I-like protein
MAKILLAAAAATFDLTSTESGAPDAVRLLPAGEFRAADGRPDKLPGWRLTPASAARNIAEMASRRSARVIDYEHATLRAKETGQKAPAAGWYEALEWRPDGLWATQIDWTAAAAAEIAEKAYRYISPVFSYDQETGDIVQVLHAALTNDPGLDGLTDLAALTAQLNLQTPPTEDIEMSEVLKALLAALGLKETATPAEALAAVDALKANVVALRSKYGTSRISAGSRTESIHIPYSEKLSKIRSDA